jgi:hypothetical protein
MYKTATTTGGTGAAVTLTVTSPNTKHIFLKQYLVAVRGTGPTADITISIQDEDSNVLWIDNIHRAVATLTPGPMRADHTFPGKGLLIPNGKNLKIVCGDPGDAGAFIDVSALYDI